MQKSFEDLCELYPQLERLKPLTVNRYSCNIYGFTSVFYNEYSILKFWIDISLRDLEIFEEPNLSEYRTIIINHFMQIASEEWENEVNKGTFSEELTEEEDKYRIELHNSHLRHLRQLQIQYL